MGFIMRAYRRSNWLTAAALIAVLSASVADAEFTVTNVEPRLAAEALALSGALDLGLSAKVEEALSKGIPMEVIVDISLYRERPVVWDARIQTWVLRRRISYHALSRQYLLMGHRPDAAVVESFLSLQSALTSMGSLDELSFPLNGELDSDSNYYVEVRASLDIESLPAPLRPVAYTSLAWHLSSGWTEWHVQR